MRWRRNNSPTNMLAQASDLSRHLLNDEQVRWEEAGTITKIGHGK